MIRLAIVTALLAVALVVVKRRGRRGPSGAALRVASRTGISRGVLAAVIEVEQRRFLVTITASSTTLVAELGPDAAVTVPASPAPGAVAMATAPAAVPLAAGPAAHPAPARTALAAALPSPTAGPLAAPAAATAPAAPVAPPAPTGPAADASFLDRIRARTLRTYDPALVGPVGEDR